jgi:wyosine [tRNA(Phe)-imidazoG37] synthetase (radical SAM superfamily)
MKRPANPDPARSLFQSHPRSFEANRYVYPVLSRRCGGISVGVNINRDQGCNFRCVYCQVNRTEPGEQERVDLGRLAEELERTIEQVASGRIYQETKFRDTPGPLRRLSDIAISGDGEPTLYADFDRVVAVCADVRRRRGLRHVKLVLITNSSELQRDRARRGLEILDANGGEIWAKLDAGTEAYYRQVARSCVPFRQILDNLCQVAQARPIVIQSLFMRVHGDLPPRAEQEAYCDRLLEILDFGGRIKLVQIHTVARPPAESWVTALSPAELDTVAERVRVRTGLRVASFCG